MAEAAARARFSRKPTRREAAWGGGALLVVAAIVIFLALFDWNWLRGPIGSYASARTGRVVRLQGDLKVRLWSWTPEARVGDLRIGHPKWAGPGDTARIPQLIVRVRLMPLFARQVDLPLIELHRPDLILIKDKEGRATWKLSQKPDDRPTRLPPIQRLVIRDGRIRFHDQKRRIRIDGRIESHEAVASGGGAGFLLDGRGSVKGEPFLLTVRGGPIVNIRKDRPYALAADIRAGATRIHADGVLPRPFDLGYIDARITASGRDLADLYDLTGAVTPNSPPYRLNARLVRRMMRYEFTGISGRVGDSDLAGDLSVDKSSGRAFLKADLSSRSLDFDDLAAVFGARPAARAGETYAPARSGGRMLPDATLKTERLRGMDADVRYRAASVRTRRIPLRQVSAHIRLNDGVLVADPVAFAFPQGRITGKGRIDARGRVPVSDIDVRVQGVRVEHLTPAVRGSRPVEGPIQARARLHGTGASVRAAAAGASGAASVVVSNGEVRKAFAELLGINLVPGLLQLWSKDQSDVRLTCAVAHFEVRGGVMRATRMVADTDIVVVDGQGSINLADETIDLRLRGKSKKVRILRLLAPIHISGPLSRPRVKAELGKAAPQIGVAAGLAALVTPLAVVLPFIDPGLAKDANCAALTAEARSGSAPAPKAGSR